MKSISFWARKHCLTARFYIVLIHLALISFAIYIGTGLHSLYISFPPSSLYLAIAVFILAAAFYPTQKKDVITGKKPAILSLVSVLFLWYAF